MKILRWLVGILMVVAVVVFGLQVIASETGEVVLLDTRTADGEVQTTRLWVVEDDGDLWLRAGGGEASGWFGRLIAEPRVELERDGVRATYLATVVPERKDRINRLMQDKYGWRDEIIAVLAGSRDNAVAIRLAPET